jgi:NAD+ synthase (glutamine-hydrolysing)
MLGMRLICPSLPRTTVVFLNLIAFSSLFSFLEAVPTAELEPITETYVQADEADMGMTYDELSVFGRLRKVEKCGPYSTFTKLIHEWGALLSPTQVSDTHMH